MKRKWSADGLGSRKKNNQMDVDKLADGFAGQGHWGAAQVNVGFSSSGSGVGRSKKRIKAGGNGSSLKNVR